MSKFHKFIKGILCVLVVTSTATAVMAEETVLVTAKAHDQRRSVMNMAGISSRSLAVTIATRLAMLKREERYPRKTGLPVIAWAGAAPGELPMQATSGCICNSSLKTNGSRSRTRPSFSMLIHAMVCPSRHERAGSAGHLSVYQEYGSCWRNRHPPTFHLRTNRRA